MQRTEINYEIQKNLGMLSSNERGFTKELNLVSWNGSSPKLDIRSWYPDREKCGKGLTLTNDEAKALMVALEKYFSGKH